MPSRAAAADIAADADAYTVWRLLRELLADAAGTAVCMLGRWVVVLWVCVLTRAVMSLPPSVLRQTCLLLMEWAVQCLVRAWWWLAGELRSYAMHRGSGHMHSHSMD